MCLITRIASRGLLKTTSSSPPSLSSRRSPGSPHPKIEALQGLEALLSDVVVDMQKQGEDVPEPISERSYSGKFNLRLGEKLHREVALRAAEENLSINQWVVRKLMTDA